LQDYTDHGEKIVIEMDVDNPHHRRRECHDRNSGENETQDVTVHIVHWARTLTTDHLPGKRVGKAIGEKARGNKASRMESN
jgi:hypothetical protein